MLRSYSSVRMREKDMAGHQLQRPVEVSKAADHVFSSPHWRQERVQEFLPFIKYHALRMAARLPHSVDVEDLTHAGVVGLLDALEKFDPSKGVQLRTYAEFRIRGAVLDELRGMDWATRSTREKIKRLEDAYSTLEKRLLRAPGEDEVAEYLGLGLEDLHQLILEARGVGLISIEEILSSDAGGSAQSREPPEDTDPHEHYAWKELRIKMTEAVAGLTEREQQVLSLYYYEELTMKEIGLVLGVTESRVSQIHTQAILKLKTRLRGHV